MYRQAKQLFGFHHTYLTSYSSMNWVVKLTHYRFGYEATLKMFLRKFLLLLISSIIVSSQKSSDSSSAVATVSVVFTTPAVEKSTSLIPTNRVTTTPTAAVLPTTSISNTVVKSTETASISAVPSPTLSSFTVSTSSSTANSTLTVPDVLGEIIGDPESYEVAEIDYPPDVPSPDELVDLSAYQIDLYAADVASGEHQIIASGSDEGAKVVLPVCPDVGPLSSGPKKRAAKKAVFDCTPNSLSIPVHIHWVVNKTKTAEEMTNMETKMYQQVAWQSNLDASVEDANVSCSWSSWNLFSRNITR